MYVYMYSLSQWFINYVYQTKSPYQMLDIKQGSVTTQHFGIHHGQHSQYDDLAIHWMTEQSWLDSLNRHEMFLFSKAFRPSLGPTQPPI